jgi:hypothetical protein
MFNCNSLSTETCCWVCTRDVSLETWSWSRDRPRPLFSGLGLVLVSIGPVLVSNTGSKKVLVGLGHCMHGQALKGAFNNHCQSIEGLV